MSKRPPSPHDARQGDAQLQPGKRQQTQDPRDNQISDTQLAALRSLADDADDLIATLQRLKTCRNDGQPWDDRNPALVASRQDLTEISRRITPHLHAIATVPDSTPSSFSLSLRMPSMAMVTPWRSAEMSEQLPPLPPIQDSKLKELAFTHPGFVPGSSPDKQYERLEWLGDAYLELISTALIDKTFLHLPSGRCSQIRERLIRNTTLASYFREYGFEQHAKLPTDLRNGRQLGRGSSKDKDLLKTQADMFEAYAAAVILDNPGNGLETTIAWLKALWARSIIEDVRQAEEGNPTTDAPLTTTTKKQTPKEELSARIVVKGVAIRYETVPSNKRDKNLDQQLFSVAVYLDGWGETGKLLGYGSALSVKEAGQKAAAAALQNRKLLKVYESKKRAIRDAREAVAEQGAA